MRQLTVNPGLTLTGFRTTRPRLLGQVKKHMFLVPARFIFLARPLFSYYFLWATFLWAKTNSPLLLCTHQNNVNFHC